MFYKNRHSLDDIFYVTSEVIKVFKESLLLWGLQLGLPLDNTPDVAV